jgi:glycerol kinase
VGVETWLQYSNRILRPRRRQPHRKPRAAQRKRNVDVIRLALDQGTTSARALLFDHAGTIHAIAQRRVRQSFPQPGWVEHDAAEIWTTQSGVMHEVLAKTGLGARDVAALGITHQRETTVLWTAASGAPVAPAIVWQDAARRLLCDTLRGAGHAPLFAHKTGLVLDAYFSGTKLKWLLDNVPGARVRATKGELAFGTIDTWLVWNLTRGAEHVTDPSNASRTLLFDIRAGGWDDELLALLDIPRAVLPRVVPSSAICAHASIDGVDVPIAGIAGDQQAALFGQACHSPGLAKNTYGTGCFLLMNTGNNAVASATIWLTTVAWQRDGATDYALEGQRVHRRCRRAMVAATASRSSRPPRNRGARFERSRQRRRLLVPAFAGLGAPHWDAYARGAIFGLREGQPPPTSPARRSRPSRSRTSTC